VTQHNTGTTLTLTNAVDWSGATLDTLWATAGNWGGTVPGATLDNTIANFPTGVTPVVADLVATSRTLAVLNINTGTLAASNYSITSTGGGTINLGAMPTDSAQMAAQINVLKGTSNTISAPVALSMNGQVNTAASTSLNMSGAISGSGFSLTKVGAGTLVLSGGANSYTGATIIEEGILSVSNLANAGANSDLGNYPTAGAAGIVIKGGTLKYTGGTMGTAIDRGITLTASSTVDLPIAGDMRIGSLALASAAAMDLIVTGNGVAASRLYIDSVTVPTSTGNRVGPVFKPNTASLTIGSITGNGNFQMQGAAGASDNIINGPINLGKGNTTLNQEQIFGPIAANTWTIMSENTFDGRWYAAAGIVKIKSPGSLVLGQNVSYAFGQVADTAMNWPGVNETATKFYNGNTDVQLLNDLSTSYQYKPGARVSVRAAAAVKFTVGPIGAATNQTHNLGNMWVHDNNTTVTVDAVGASGYGLTFDDVYFRDSANMSFAGNAPLTLASATKANGTTNQTATFNRTGATTISGAFGQGTGVLNLTKNNTGVLNLNGAGTHIGTTTVSNGRIVMGNAQALQYSAYNTAGSNGSTIGVDANGSATVTLGGLSGAVDLASAMVGYTTSVTGLTLQPQSGTVTYTGVIADGSAATTLTKAGGGTQILQNANLYTGGTNVNAGTLRLNGAFNMPATGTLQVNGGGNFSLGDGTVGNTTTAALSLASGANLTFDWSSAGTVDNLASTAPATTLTGTTMGIIINPIGTPTGGGTLLSAASGLQTGTATYFLANNTNFTAALTQSDSAVSIGSYAAATALTNAYWRGGQVTGALGAMAYSLGATSNWATDAAGTAAPGVVPGGNAVNVIFGASGATEQASVTTGASMNLGSITFNDADAVTLGGSHTITLNSTSGTLPTPAGANQTVTAGSAIAVTTHANVANTIGANILVAANQTWNVATGKTLTVSGAISGNFDIIKNSPGTLVLSGNNTAHTGTMTITAGIVRGGANASTSSGNLNFNGGVLEGGGTLTRGLGQMAGLVQWTGTGGFAAFGAPLTVTLGGPSGVDWALSNAAGGLNGQNLLFGSATSDNVVTLTNNLNMKGNRTVTVNDNNLSAADHTVFSGVLADGDTTARNFTKAGLGTLVLSGGNSYSGTTTVSAGTLAAAHATALGTTGANTSVSNGATLDVRATVAEPISITGTGVGGAGALITATANTGTVGGTVTLTGATSIGGAGTGILNINGIVAAGANTLTTLGTGETTFGAASTLTSVASLAVTDGTTNVNSALGTAGNTAVNVSDLGNGTKLRFGSVSQTLTSLTIGAGATVIFTSGLASGSLGDDGGGKAAGFGSPAFSFSGGATVPEPGTLGLLLVGALGMLNRRRRQA
jgi:autotransporter-associated beta strand protein